MTYVTRSDQIGGESLNIDSNHAIDLSGNVIMTYHLHVSADLEISVGNCEPLSIIFLHITQDNVGGHAITFSDQFKWGNPGPPVLTTDPNGVDNFILRCGVDGTMHCHSREIDVK